MKLKILTFCMLFPFLVEGQGVKQGIKGKIKDETQNPVPLANISVKNSNKGTAADKNGHYQLMFDQPGNYTLIFSSTGYQKVTREIDINPGQIQKVNISFKEQISSLDQVVVTGTMKETYVTQSPVKVNVIPSEFLQKNRSNNLMEALFNVNGVQEQIDCGVCFTNSIRVNGLEGPYTMVLIDGMPMFSNLATVYGLNGIPTSSIKRIEVIKGPNSTLYGSEAVAGVINVITKHAHDLPKASLDIYGTSDQEINADWSLTGEGKKFHTMLTGNYYHMGNYIDDNGDGFADVIQSDRISLFNKWEFNRESGKKFDISAKYYYEDRKGGTKKFLTKYNPYDIRGNDTIYGESIFTRRFSLFGTYELPASTPLKLDFSFNRHKQNSYYGDEFYLADQNIFFSNLIWTPDLNSDHSLLGGLTYRYQTYNDNTPATTQVEKKSIPGIFLQDEWQLHNNFSSLVGARLDYYEDHGPIFSPRLNLKYKPTDNATLRGNFGTGFRIVNLFTEDHAVLTNAREVVIEETLDPEKSYNVALNYNQYFFVGEGQGSFDLNGFYTYFFNKIIPDYSQKDKIIYANLDGYAVSRGLSASVQHYFSFPLSVDMGVTFQNVYETDGEGNKNPIVLTPKWTGNFTVSYEMKEAGLSFDYTGNIVGEQPLPEVAGRPDISETFTIQNLQVSKSLNKQLNIYAGVKNIWDWTQNSPLIAPQNPEGPAGPGFHPDFDTIYAYGPLQGRRFLLGVSYQLE